MVVSTFSMASQQLASGTVGASAGWQLQKLSLLARHASEMIQVDRKHLVGTVLWLVDRFLGVNLTQGLTSTRTFLPLPLVASMAALLLSQIGQLLTLLESPHLFSLLRWCHQFDATPSHSWHSSLLLPPQVPLPGRPLTGLHPMQPSCGLPLPSPPLMPPQGLPLHIHQPLLLQLAHALV